MGKLILVSCLVVLVLSAFAAFEMDKSVMSDKYWEIWNDAEQAKIDADIEANRKADGTFVVDAPAGTDVKVEQLDHEFRFGAHIFNYDQLGKKEYNDAYKASYGKDGIFNQATVAFYWNCYEPVPGRLRAFGDYEDTAHYWNSLTRAEAMEHPFWRRPAPAPVIDYLRAHNVAIHGHILIWGSAKPNWIYDWYCPESEKRAFDALGIPRHDAKFPATDNWDGGYNNYWRGCWSRAYADVTEASIAAMAPTFTKRMPEIFRKRVFDVAQDFGEVVDSWDVVNESSQDWVKYRKSRTGLPVWKSSYGLMPGDYPLHALLDAKEAFPDKAKLAINDWNICKDFLSQVKDLESEGAKIDIVGCQMHIFNTNECMRLALGATNVNWVGMPQTIQARLDMMAKTGRPLHVSEITITSPGADERSRMIQAILTRNIYRKWFSHKALMGITWWNTVDGGGVKGEPLVSGLFTTDLKPKPAYLALDQLINHEWKTRLKLKTVSVGESSSKHSQFKHSNISFRGFRGKYRLSWEDDAGVLHYRDVYLTGDGVKESAAKVRSLLESPAEMPVDHLRVVPSVKVYGLVPKKESTAVTIAEAAAQTGRAPAELRLEEVPVRIDTVFKDCKYEVGSEGTEAVYLTFRVVAPRRMRTYLFEKSDWYLTAYVNGRKIESFAGCPEQWSGYPVVFKSGENEVVVRSSAGLASWVATLAIRDPEKELVFR